MFALAQQQSIVVEVLRQPEVTRDVSVDAVLSMFMLAGVAIAIAAVGGLLAGVLFVGLRRLHDASATSSDHSHVRLRI